MDLDANMAVNYSEFLAATLDINSIVKENEGSLLRVFNQFDMDGSGEITKQDLKLAFTKFGKKLSNQEMDDLMAAHDEDKDGTISFEEFKKMMLQEGDIADKIDAENENCLKES